MKILSITSAEQGWIARFFWPPKDGDKGWHENRDVIVWALVEDANGQRVVGFAENDGGLSMCEQDEKECFFRGYHREPKSPTE